MFVERTSFISTRVCHFCSLAIKALKANNNYRRKAAGKTTATTGTVSTPFFVKKLNEKAKDAQIATYTNNKVHPNSLEGSSEVVDSPVHKNKCSCA